MAFEDKYWPAIPHTHDLEPDLESALKAEAIKAEWEVELEETGTIAGAVSVSESFHEQINLVQSLKTHAIANYNAGGWDVIVECYTDFEISEILTEANATTLDEAIKAFSSIVDVMAERQADARISAGCTCTDASLTCHCHE